MSQPRPAPAWHPGVLRGVTCLITHHSRAPPTHSKPERLRTHGESVPVRQSHGCGDGLPVDTHGVHQGHAAQDDLAPLHVQQGMLAGHRGGVDTDVRAWVPEVRGHIGASGAALSVERWPRGSSAHSIQALIVSPFGIRRPQSVEAHRPCNNPAHRSCWILWGQRVRR
jgi:hypothetical protein